MVSNISKTLKASESVEEVLQVLEDSTEFELVPVWHNEDNTDLAKVNPYKMESLHIQNN